MENWENLNKLLILEQKEVAIREELSKQLIEASSNGDKTLAKSILKKGAFLNCSVDDLTPLIACIENNHLSLAQFYLKHNASIIYRPTTKFVDALWYALTHQKHEFLTLFVQHRCQLIRQHETNHTPLIFATIQTDKTAVEILVQHSNIKVNERDGSGNTALHYNVTKENPTQDDFEIGKILIAAGADTKGQNFDGKSPSDLAMDTASRAVILAGELEQEILASKQKAEAEMDAEIPAEPKPSSKRRVKI